MFVRDFTVYSILSDMMMGVPAVYACFAGYDEVAHHSGLERHDTLEVLRKIDQQFGRIARARKYAARPYEIVVLSDHGQTQGATFLQRNGYGLDELVERNLRCRRRRGPRRRRRERHGRLQGRARGHRVASRRTRTSTRSGDRKIVVMGSGNLGLIYLMDEPRRLTMEEIDDAASRTCSPALRAHPHVGWLLVRSAEHGAVALGARGANYLSEGRVEGEDPLAPFSPTAAAHLLRTDGFEHVADIMVNSFYDEQLDEGCAFEELISFHGGMGGPQTRPFILHPVELEAPDEPIIGAEAAHRVLAGWRRRLQGEAAPPAETSGRRAVRAGDGADVRPRRLNAVIAVLFMIGSFGFALGCDVGLRVGGGTDARRRHLLHLVDLLHHAPRSSSSCRASRRPMAATGTARDDERQHLRFLAWLPHDKAWLAAATQFPGTLFFNGTTFWAITVALDNSKYDKVVWRPDFYGSILFLVSSAFAILALGRLRRWRPREAAWWVAWLNMIGSIAFMASAIGAFVIPRTDSAVDLTLADRGTWVGAVCFFLGALLAIPAWRQAGEAAAAEREAERRPRAPPAARPPDRRRCLRPLASSLPRGSSSARGRSALSASLTAFLSALASWRSTSSTQISSKTAMMPDVPGGTTSSTSLAMPFSSWCLTSLPASPPIEAADDHGAQQRRREQADHEAAGYADGRALEHVVVAGLLDVQRAVVVTAHEHHAVDEDDAVALRLLQRVEVGLRGGGVAVTGDVQVERYVVHRSSSSGDRASLPRRLVWCPE